jgi:hypothetical protein
LTPFSTTFANKPADGLEANWVHTPGRLRTTLGGSLGSVSARVAREVVLDASSAAGPTVDQARTTVDRLLAASTALPTYERIRMSDEDTLDWIAAHLDEVPHASASSALRALRTSGHACEQRHFARLFATAWSQRA